MQGAVFGKYVVQHRLAIGGMGEVFYVLDGDTPAILKVMLAELASQPGFVDQFLDEARLASYLYHPNIVSLYEVGIWEGSFVIAMEYIHGRELGELRKRAAERNLRVPPMVAARIVADAAAGLDHAHHAVDEKGQPLSIVHRDISPQNLMVRDDGVTKVVDFGIARASNRPTRTATGVVKGKLAYMAPEQVSGLPVTASSDQFALGLVLWELLSGERAYPAEDDVQAVNLAMAAGLSSPTSKRADVPEALSEIAMKMVSKSPAQRYATCAAAAHALNANVTPGATADVAAFMRVLGNDDLEKKVRPAASRLGNMVVSIARTATPMTRQSLETSVTTLPSSRTPALHRSASSTLKRMDAYLESLPNGLESYPEAQQKASVLAVFLQGVPIQKHLAALPQELAALIKRPPPPSVWMPEVKATAIYLACADSCFESDDAYVAFAYESNKRLVEGPLYWMLFRALGIQRVATAAADRWASFHRGTTTRMHSFKEGEMILRLTCPPNHIPHLLMRCYATSTLAAFEAAGARNAKVSAKALSVTEYEAILTWTP